MTDRAADADDLRALVVKTLRSLGVDDLRCRGATDAILDAAERRPELPSAAEQRATLDALARQHGRHAASMLARLIATDPGDAREIHRLEQKYRRWRREKKNAHCAESVIDDA